MKAATIDIGTNSTRLLVAEVTPDKSYLALARRAVITRLGEGVNKNQMLSSEAILRSEEVLHEYAREIQKQRVEQVWAVGTSALREAENSHDFLDRIKNEFGWTVEIISGEREAQLSFLGATEGLAGTDKEVLVIDIGGGSTELILGRKKEIVCYCSLDIGCVRLTEIFMKNDPLREENMEKMGRYVREKIGEAPQQLWRSNISSAIGLAGTITTLSAIKQGMSVYDSERIHGSLLTLEEVKEILQKLASLTLEERKRIVGLEARRADVIVAGVEILLELMKKASLSQITVSEHDILDGILLSKVISGR